MDPDESNKFFDWFLKIDPPVYIDGGFDFLNVRVDDPYRETFLVGKPMGVPYDILKNHIMKIQK